MKELRRVLEANDQSFPERRESRLELIDLRRSIKVEKAIDVRRRDSKPASQFHLTYS